ncbi:hypothetical protein N7474_006234 [Penicillium riverlandense]|uniref:uncharacterized protein n=1 Tax=Penicillium riverlandense TaxID=1903569 RepID=UPI002548C6BD|nr:uncharacterized protein N7474_006234 [Penicillium riverlandense]KAJ5820643.1 hypothetical protein N7474_006234 [Penicillium riverlandense]
MRRYSSAVGSLRTSLDQQVDDFSACAAALFTLAQIEGCYAPECDEWRKHLLEIARTGSGGSFGCRYNTDHLLESISRISHFGYTIGASNAVLQSIMKVHRLAEALRSGESLIEVEVQCGKILGELGTSESDTIITPPSQSRQGYLSSLHRRIFRNAAVIYLYRVIYDVAPIAIRDQVFNVLCDTISFLDVKGGSVSLWPVFIAAVEACSKQERDLVRQWLEYSCKLGISNRRAARCIIEEVWKQRDQEALLRDIEPEYVAVDWRQVQYRLKIDILLL